MATKDSNIVNEIKVLDFLWPYSQWCIEKDEHITKAVLDKLMLAGELDISTVYENVLAYQSKGTYVKESVDGRDFSDGSDAKKVSVVFHRGRHDAPVRGITTKTGLLRVLLHDPFNDEFFFFKIPHRAYKNLGVIEIQFGHGQNQRRAQPNRGTKWWRYEVDTLEQLSA